MDVLDSFNEKILTDHHRKLLNGLGPTESLYGFECHDGWVSLIDGTLRLITRYASKHDLEVKVDQVKEKFGLLRVYLRGGDIMVDRILDVAEVISSCTCEVCGGAGRLFQVNGWLQVRCLKHQLPRPEESTGCHYDESYAISFAKVVSLILWFFKDKYATWLNQECLALGRVRPREALTSTQGCEAIYDLLKRLEHGVIV